MTDEELLRNALTYLERVTDKQIVHPRLPLDDESTVKAGKLGGFDHLFELSSLDMQMEIYWCQWAEADEGHEYMGSQYSQIEKLNSSIQSLKATFGHRLVPQFGFKLFEQNTKRLIGTHRIRYVAPTEFEALVRLKAIGLVELAMMREMHMALWVGELNERECRHRFYRYRLHPEFIDCFINYLKQSAAMYDYEISFGARKKGVKPLLTF